MKQKNAQLPKTQFELVKSPVVAEFLGFKNENSYLEGDLKRTAGDNPTIGILLCSETDEDIARYSVLHENDRLFMSKYLTYLPTKEQLKHEIERQKAIFYMQHPLQIEEGGEDK